MKILEENGCYYVENEEGMTIGEGRTPLAAACSAASEYYAPGSYFWHICVSEVIRETDPKVLNHWEDPFSEA